MRTIKQMASAGGRARASKLSQERRRDIARKAGIASGIARIKKNIKKDLTNIEHAGKMPV